MYRNILIPTDGSRLADRAAKTGARLARELNARVTAVYVIRAYDPPSGTESMIFESLFTPEQYLENMRSIAQKALDKVKAASDAEKVACETLAVVDYSPWEGILRATRAKKCDAIVMASTGRSGVAGILLGSETQKVLTHSKTPVLVCR